MSAKYFRVMASKNLEAVYRAYAAIRRHDKEAFVREQHPDVVGELYVMEAEGTVYRGHSGMRRFLDELYSVFPNWRPEVVRTQEHGDAVLVEVRMSGSGARSGLALEQTIWQVITFREGKAVSFRGYGSRSDALEALEASGPPRPGPEPGPPKPPTPDPVPPTPVPEPGPHGPPEPPRPI
jgi:ketosteroid isomerase-like protein